MERKFTQRILRLQEVVEKLAVGRTKIYQWVKDGTFPKQIKMGKRSGWIESEIDAWIEERANERYIGTE